MMLCDGQMFTPLIATAEPLLSVFKEADEAGNPYASLHFDLDELQYLRHEREKAGDVEYWIPKAEQIEEIVANGYISSPAMKKLEEQINRSGGDAEFLKGLWPQVSTEKLDQFESINAVMSGLFPGAQGHEDGEEFPEEELKKISYPYSTKKRTVVFGGHDSFLRAIKPMLPEVKFVDTDQYGFAPEIVRNADVVWVQTNCISHSQYNNITRLTRQYGIQLRYFGYASAEKCAEQLVTEDEK